MSVRIDRLGNGLTVATERMDGYITDIEASLKAHDSAVKTVYIEPEDVSETAA